MSAACPYCRAPFEPDEEIVSCLGCNTTHHADCLAENGGCTVFGCSRAPVDEPKISVSSHDLSHPGADRRDSQAGNANSILNLQAPSPPPATSTPAVSQPTPPPPTEEGSMLPPPPPPPAAYGANDSPYSSYLNLSGYGLSSSNPANDYVPRKSRVVFVLLAVFLGPFGGHNFYAGYVKKAVIQLCITVLTCFLGSTITWIWAIVEACTIDHDDNGLAFV